MIVLDTNVVSELFKPAPAGRVEARFIAQPAASLFSTTITQAEALYGVALLPPGKRRTALEIAAEAMFPENFASRVLPFDGAATRDAPGFAGRGIEVVDPWRA